MARIRYIKHGFFTNEQLADCSAQARLLFAGLWIVADSAGRVEDRPRKLKAELFPFDDWNINEMLDELHQAKLIVRYEVNDARFIQVINFTKHQRPHPNEPDSLIPSPYPEENKEVSEVASQEEEATSNEKKLLVVKNHEDSLQSTERSVRNRNGNRNGNGNRKGTGVGSRSSSERRTSIVKTCDEEFLTDLKNNPAYSQLDVDRLFHKMVAWCELKGKQPTRARFLNWLNREDVPMAKPAEQNVRKFVPCG